MGQRFVRVLIIDGKRDSIMVDALRARAGGDAAHDCSQWGWLAGWLVRRELLELFVFSKRDRRMASPRPVCGGGERRKSVLAFMMEEQRGILILFQVPCMHHDMVYCPRQSQRAIILE